MLKIKLRLKSGEVMKITARGVGRQGAGGQKGKAGRGQGSGRGVGGRGELKVAMLFSLTRHNATSDSRNRPRLHFIHSAHLDVASPASNQGLWCTGVFRRVLQLCSDLTYRCGHVCSVVLSGIEQQCQSKRYYNINTPGRKDKKEENTVK